MPSGTSSEEVWELLEAEFTQERAAVLGRLGRRVEVAIKRCEELLELTAAGTEQAIDAYERARRAALDAISDLCLQREIVGFSDQRWVYQEYRVPPSLRPRNR